MASSSKSGKGKEPVGSGSGSGSESGWGNGDDSGSEQFSSYDTPDYYYDSNGSYESSECGNWLYNRALGPKWTDRPICKCGHRCTYLECKAPGEQYKKRYWKCPARILNNSDQPCDFFDWIDKWCPEEDQLELSGGEEENHYIHQVIAAENSEMKMKENRRREDVIRREREVIQKEEELRRREEALKKREEDQKKKKRRYP